jgi:hypothetical protein
MNELEADWALAMQAAELQARQRGSGDVFDYLRLREVNDAARRVGIDWLFNTFLEVAAEANRRGIRLITEKADDHKFSVGAATMKGAFVRLRFGQIRAMTIEAGFPRLPQDGFVRGGGLACARVSHFGQAQANEDLLLVRSDANRAPAWIIVDKNGAPSRESFQTARLKHHFATFLGQI